jgi:hypothetical protein
LTGKRLTIIDIHSGKICANVRDNTKSALVVVHANDDNQLV